MNQPPSAAGPQPGDALVAFRYAGQLYKGVLRPSEAATWRLLVAGEWWGDLSYEVGGYRFVDVDGSEQPFTVLEDFATISQVPAPTAAKNVLRERLALRFRDDRLSYRYFVEQQTLSKDWERFLLLQGGSTITLISDRPFVRRTQGKSAHYTLRLPEGQRANEGFLSLLLAHLRKLIQTHFDT